MQTLHSLLKAVELPVPPDLLDAKVSGITCDSRLVGEENLFIGLPGERVDGGSFWPKALALGASAALIGQKAAHDCPPESDDPVVVLPDPVAYWAGELASAFWQRPSIRMELIGVTGTNGKTTITHLIEHLSQECGRPAALFGTLVNRWPGHSTTATHTTSVADRLQSQLAEALDCGAQLAAMEVSSHALEQHRVAGCRFSGAIFTNLTQDHLDYHQSMQAYFEAKALLFTSRYLLGEGPRAVVNVDDPWGRQLADRLGQRCWTSSLAHSADLTMSDLIMTSSGVDGLLMTPLGQGRFHSPLVGRFNLMNLLQAIGALLQQGLPLGLLLQNLPTFRGVPGRMERVLVPGLVEADLPSVIVDYAHTPDGLRNALIASRPFTKGRLLCVFGCGGDRDRGKRPQMAAIASELADQVVVTSDNPRTEDPHRILEEVRDGLASEIEFSLEVDRATAIANAIVSAEPGDLVLIAGKGHEDYQILGTEKIHFDDREEAEKALRRYRIQ